ncbi:tRNA (adenosine(37)-N6)-dimethylallyltransferase MiaA [Apibacter sp. B3924]|nr:tRNA (adenosine(37)-N6)-dimethylallyltransferase MiaA [Apibacter sp. B3919]MXO25190.1 tRNA (adenosine(37)-N6)-dimethylallyltransferase MiaA [Apibacter sp. B3924]MXO27393.1 tRNA (adenosine(37)-N6)-dimethylallyltransferase MiaA [Apibacter sp. B3813]MXO29206.1 tRNA (adenosine(37)-N6)-dimethylallyltransferase MiaA [Apibacter sp. B3913]MXO31291.1 tRNA (adenosine(37)-N6)-dimethylallyltransferase MiaA [Apibacter sp. B3912]MXP02548.1 tRNA (adenosine(37)-N6)-dimethylallyltransferase MiaA [Apibacter 
MNKNPKILWSIVGPTGIGKTALSIELAKNLKTEIISCDSRQFYKELKIGTAAPSSEELSLVPHHFIGNLSIAQDYSVGDFEKDALRKINELFNKYDQLIMVGGSGLYEKAVNEGLDNFPDIDTKVREDLMVEIQEKGLSYLQEELKKNDPEYYSQVDYNNPQRVMRALEIFRGTGKPYSSFRKNLVEKRNFTSVKIGLTASRDLIYDRINKRVDLMMEKGLLEEVISLQSYRHKNALQTVGYKELFDYLDGNSSLEFSVSEIKKNSRRYAKRQLTWYRRDESVNWFDYQSTQEIVDFVTEKIR